MSDYIWDDAPAWRESLQERLDKIRAMVAELEVRLTLFAKATAELADDLDALAKEMTQ